MLCYVGLYDIFFIQQNLNAVWFLLYGDFLRTTLYDTFIKILAFRSKHPK